MDRFPLGYNTYSIRALRWNDLQLIEYASSLKLDAIFLQDSIDPGINDPAHWKAVKDAAARAGLWLGTGGGAVLPKDENEFDRSVKLLSDSIQRAAASFTAFQWAGSLVPGSMESCRKIASNFKELAYSINWRSFQRRARIEYVL